jgi:hypothetical protein
MFSHSSAAVLGVVAAALTALAPSAVANGAAGQDSAASAACRQYGHSAKDKFNDGYPSKSSVPVREDGPSADCYIDGYIDDSTRLHYHCYITNGSGNRWTWVRAVGEDIAGWVYGANLKYGGSTEKC